MSEFYVYEHLKADTGEVFYVGKGCGHRFRRAVSRSDFWKNVVAKHGFVPRIVVGGIDEDLALLAEIELIDKHIRLGKELVNLTSGGEGWSGDVSQVSRQKLSQALKASWAVPGERERRAEILKNAYSTPEMRAQAGEKAKKFWARDEVRIKHAASSRKRWSDPGARAAQSEKMRAAYADPELRKRLSEAVIAGKQRAKAARAAERVTVVV